jgi:PAS domain S-box-containing protein
MNAGQFLQLADLFPDAALLLNKDGVVLAANRALAALTSWPDVVGRALPEMTVTAPDAVRDYLRLCSRSRAPVVGALTLRAASGREVVCRCYGALAGPDPGGPAGVLLRLAPREGARGEFAALTQKVEELTREVHRRRRAEEELRQAVARHRAMEEHLTHLVEASGTLTDTLDPPAVLSSVLRLAGRLLPADAHAVWRFHPRLGRWLLAQSAGLSDAYREATARGLEEATRMPETPVLAEDVFAQPMLAARAGVYRAEGIRSLAALPLRIHGEVCGTLAVYHRTPHRFDDVEVRVATAVANLAAAAIGTADLYEEQGRLRAEAQAREEWLQVTLASIGDAVIVTDVEGRTSFLNAAAQALTGWPQAEALGRPLEAVFRIVNEHTRQPAENPVAKALRLGAVVGLANHTALIARDGAERSIADSAAPIRDGRGGVSGVVLIFRDVTNERRAEAARGQLAAIVESSDDAVYSKTLDGVITSWNKGAERLYGYAAAEVLGRPGAVLVPPDRADELDAVLGRIRRGEVADHFPTVRRCKDGTLLDVSVSVSAITDAEGNVVGASTIARDITRQIRAERAVQESGERLRLALEAGRMGTWEWRLATDAVVWSAGLEAVHGLAPGAFAGTFAAYLETIHPDDRRPVQDALRRAVDEGRDYRAEYRLAWPDGSLHWVEARGTVFRDGAGRPDRVVGVGLEVTERKKARAALEESEQRFRQLAEHITDVFWMTDPTGPAGVHELLYVSPAYETIWGRSCASLYENPPTFLDAVHPADRDRLVAKMAKQAAGEPMAEEYRVVRPDGSVRWVYDRGFPIRNEAGRVYRVAGIAEDVTARKRAEQDARFLADASAALAGLVDYQSTLQKVARLAVPSFADWCAVDMLDEGGTLRRLAVAHVDPSKVELAHEVYRRRPPDPAAPRGVWHILRTGESEMTPEITDALLTASVTDDDYLLGVLRRLGLRSYMGVPLGVRGRVLGVVTFIAAESGRRYDAADLAIAEDLAHRAAVAVENARLYQALKEADRHKDEFLALLGHELRNPLAPIRTALHLLKLPGAAAVGQRAREMMERQVEHMVRLVDDLLDVSRIMRGKVELRRAPVELATVVARAVETSQPAIDAEACTLSVQAPAESVWLHGDLIRLAQVVSNLLNNAAKYNERGGRITLEAAREGDEAVVRVRDTGVGISAELLPRIFDMFFQAERRTKESQGGLGIGLSLVKGLVEMHGGSVAAHSPGRGQGSEFVVRLPLLAGREAGSPPDEEKEPPSAPASAGLPASLPAMRVLVVDDNVDAADSLALLLRLQGHEVQVAYDGLAALAKAEASVPAVAFLDIGMPAMDGHELARAFRARPALAGVRLVALTGWGQPEDRQRTRAAGFDHHLVKPVDAEALAHLLGEG